ncbi:ankyrin repeat domain-containing protein [Lysobacter sp. M15]|uniref:ankyrin repeat domain-containing protein n=1 Tax=Lysobacter sp. M15 TaxID=2916837 RepID=UPI001F55D499|nr:ankyrin repeat domain-containing protein [Lysobacter sp. M15]
MSKIHTLPILIFLIAITSACATQKDPMPGLLKMSVDSSLLRLEQGDLCGNGAISKEKRTEVARVLATIDRPGLADALGYSPALYAVMADSPAELERLLGLGYSTSNEDGSLLHAAGYWNSVNTARYLLDHGVDPNTTNDGGGTPLMVAVSEGGPDVARLLLARAARVDNRTLRYALVCKDQDIVDLIVQAGAEIDDKTRAVAQKFNMRLPSNGR